MSVFEIIKESVDIIDAAGRYGIEVNRHKKALCPFHDDHHPSLSFKGQTFKCFGCGAGGDVIELVGRLCNMTPMEAVREINHSYKLSIDLDKPEPSDEVMRRKRQQAEKMRIAQWIDSAGNTLAQYLRLRMNGEGCMPPSIPMMSLIPGIYRRYMSTAMLIMFLTPSSLRAIQT